MHAFHENIIENLFNLQRGRFFPFIPDPVKPRSARKFEKTPEGYCLMAQLWKDIGEDMEKGQNGFPATFGDKMRRIDSNFHQYRAAE